MQAPYRSAVNLAGLPVASLGSAAAAPAGDGGGRSLSGWHTNRDRYPGIAPPYDSQSLGADS